MNEEQFLREVEGHTMTIFKDDGIYRHIRFSKNGSSVMQFDLITWQGYLCYTGDMGTYVFRRLHDMFTFFRNDGRNPIGLYINRAYWHEKLEATDRNDGSKEFSIEKFRTTIKEYVDDRDTDYGENGYAQLVEAVKEQLLDNDFQFESEARQAVEDFEFEDFEFSDFWEHDLQDYTHRYTWCCYAIVWGIQQYDKVNINEQH
jgi:hypothetical protein